MFDQKPKLSIYLSCQIVYQSYSTANQNQSLLLPHDSILVATNLGRRRARKRLRCQRKLRRLKSSQISVSNPLPKNHVNCDDRIMSGKPAKRGENILRRPQSCDALFVSHLLCNDSPKRYASDLLLAFINPPTALCRTVLATIQCLEREMLLSTVLFNFNVLMLLLFLYVCNTYAHMILLRNIDNVLAYAYYSLRPVFYTVTIKRNTSVIINARQALALLSSHSSMFSYRITRGRAYT